MSTGLQILLLIGALCMVFYVFRGVRKSNLKAQETFFWLLLTVVFVLLSIIPGIAETFAAWLGVASPVNLVYLVIIFLLLVKLFSMDRKTAKMEHQMTQLVQTIAIRQLEEENGDDRP